MNRAYDCLPDELQVALKTLLKTPYTKMRDLNDRAQTNIGYVFNKHARSVTLERPPLFIVGCGHSGTSLLLAILGAHSRIHDIPYESGLGGELRHEQRRLLREFEKRTIAAGKARWVEKTPQHIEMMDELFGLFPEAKAVVILRDGRDVACSIKARYGSFERGMRRWIADNRAGQAYWDHPQVYVIRYEAIVEDFERALRPLMAFLDEPYEPSMRAFHETPKHYFSFRITKPNSPEKHLQHRNWQVNQPIFDGRGRWHEEMSEQEKVVFKRRAGEMLVEYGYAKDQNW